MRRLLAPVLWAYDFLAEDIVVLVGAGVAVVLSTLAFHEVSNAAAGIVLFATIVIAVFVSLWRVRTAG